MGRTGKKPSNNAGQLLPDLPPLPASPPPQIAEDPDLAALWKELRKTLKEVGHVRGIHTTLVVQICRAAAIADKAARQLEKEGISKPVKEGGAEYAHPAFGVWKGATSELTKLFRELNLTPSGIQSLRLPAKETKTKKGNDGVLNLSDFIQNQG